MLIGKTDAETVALNGWQVGDILEGWEGIDYRYVDRIKITAIGEQYILCLWNDDKEHLTTLSCRDWYRIFNAIQSAK